MSEEQKVTAPVERPAARKRTRKRGEKGTGAARATTRTGYIVLERRELFAADSQEPADFVVAWVPVLNLQGEKPVPRVFEAAGKLAAVKQHTGDGADILEGVFRAVPVSSWKGAVATKRVQASERLFVD